MPHSLAVERLATAANRHRELRGPLPLEVLLEILDATQRRNSLGQCARVNSLWASVVLPKLYRHIVLGTNSNHRGPQFSTTAAASLDKHRVFLSRGALASFARIVDIPRDSEELRVYLSFLPNFPSIHTLRLGFKWPVFKDAAEVSAVWIAQHASTRTLVYYGFNEHDFVRAFVINSRKVKYLYPHIAVVVSCCSDSDGVSVFDHRVTLRMIEDLTRRHFIPRSSAKPRRQTVVFFPTSAPVEPKAWSFAAQCLAAMGLWLRQTNVAETALTVVGAELLITTHSEEDLDAEAKAEISSWNRGDPTDMLWLSHEHVEIPLTVQEALGQLPENVTLSVLTREEWLQSNQWKNVLADDEVNQWCSTVQLD